MDQADCVAGLVAGKAARVVASTLNSDVLLVAIEAYARGIVAPGRAFGAAGDNALLVNDVGLTPTRPRRIRVVVHPQHRMRPIPLV